MKDGKTNDALMRVKRNFNNINGDLEDFKSWRGGWKRVFICAPFDGLLSRSMEKIWWYCIFAKNHQYLPVAPYLYYPQFMNLSDDKEKKLAMLFAREDLKQCSEIWVFGETITPEMEELICRSGKHCNVMQFPEYEELLLFMKEEDEDE